MAKALQSADGKVLFSNSENSGRPIAVDTRPNKPKTSEGRGVFFKSMTQGGSEDCVFNDATGLLMIACRISMPASWIIELEGVEEYERRLEEHAERVRTGNEVARRDATLNLDARRQEMTGPHKIRRLRLPDTTVIVPARDGRPTLLYEDVVTVKCRSCRDDLFGVGMQWVWDWMYDGGVLQGSLGKEHRREWMRQHLPKQVAVAVGDVRYCPGCVPKGRSKL